MEELQTDTLCDYGKNQNKENTDVGPKRDGDCTANLLNGCDEIDPLDLMADNCDNESIGSNSDVWKGSDSEDESFECREDTEHQVSRTTEDISDVGLDNIVQHSGVEELLLNREKDISDIGIVDEHNKAQQVIKDKSIDNFEDRSQQNEITAKENEKDAFDQSENEKDEPLKEKNKTIANKVAEELDVQQRQIIDTIDEKTSNNDEICNIEKDHSENEELKDPEKDSLDDVIEVPEKDPLEILDFVERDPLVVDSEHKVTESVSEEPNKDLTENRPPNRSTENEDDDVEMDYDADDDGFDPSLFMPEVSMDVDDNPVVTTNGGLPHDGERCDSPSLCEPVFSTFVDEVTGAEISFNMSSEEQELRRRLYGPTNPIQMTRIHCTACNVHLGSALEGQNNRFVHPLLKVLICKECYHFYTSGDFDKDEDGSELYCRWCGQGGQVLCCSKCEFVFCKRCIRTNFGRKKMFEIRDSDCWDCFRCNSSQIVTQRIACYEFFEYIRQEMSRAATLNNSSEIWSTDYSRCCSNKKRASESAEEGKKSKRRKGDVDPDYNPLVDRPPISGSTTAMSTSSSSNLVNAPILLPKPVQVTSGYVSKSSDNDIEFVKQIAAPCVSRLPYRTILPSTVRPVQSTQHQNLLRISSPSVPPLISTSNRILGTTLQGRTTPSSIIKHEWFEKTVRAAARVNSHLSYTLTQLNKTQSQAASVEELAVVHNKLQEILSSSINSLIQIRKNLRTEFIAGIKTVRLPSKKTENFSDDDDDDVIFVNSPTIMPMPCTSQVRAAAKDPSINNTKTVNGDQPRLKVRSVMELKHVPSECITIPDDTPTPSPNGPENTKSKELQNEDVDLTTEVDPLGDVPPVVQMTQSNCASTDHIIKDNPGNSENKENGDENTEEKESSEESKISENHLVYNLKKKPTTEIKKMMAVKVNLKRVDLQELQRKLFNESH